MATINTSMQISSAITLPLINNAIKRLIENDIELGAKSVHPEIWECSWYNVDKGSASQYGYGAGDAVWVNTEDLDEFVQTYESDIRSYAIQNSKTSYKVSQLSADTDRQKLLELYKDIVEGRNGYDRLYFLGCLSDDVQIRVSLSAGNTEPPDNDAYWKDFIRRDLTGGYYESLMLSAFDSQLSSQFSEHVRKYHLGEFLGSNGKYRTGEYLENFLRRDMSNLQTSHRMLNHRYSHDMTGVDYVVESKYIDYSGGLFKWYRRWYSGFLEQGGMIDTDNAEDTGDENIYGDFCRVSLPVEYDYPTLKAGSFYRRDTEIDAKNDNGPEQYSDDFDALDYEYRYTVSVTKNMSGSSATPYSWCNGESDQQCYYETTDVVNMDNSSFAFNCANGGVFSYEVRGFKVS